MVATRRPDRHALYRFYGETGQLLYVGITADPGRRFGQHGATKSWWPTVRGITIEWHSSRRDALAAEALTIEVERPLFNRQRPAVEAIPGRRCGHCWECRTGDSCHIYAPREPDEDVLEPCDACGRPDCMFQAGLDQGHREGWMAAHDRYTQRRDG